MNKPKSELWREHRRLLQLTLRAQTQKRISAARAKQVLDGLAALGAQIDPSYTDRKHSELIVAIRRAQRTNFKYFVEIAYPLRLASHGSLILSDDHLLANGKRVQMPFIAWPHEKPASIAEKNAISAYGLIPSGGQMVQVKAFAPNAGYDSVAIVPNYLLEYAAVEIEDFQEESVWQAQRDWHPVLLSWYYNMIEENLAIDRIILADDVVQHEAIAWEINLRTKLKQVSTRPMNVDREALAKENAALQRINSKEEVEISLAKQSPDQPPAQIQPYSEGHFSDKHFGGYYLGMPLIMDGRNHRMGLLHALRLFHKEQPERFEAMLREFASAYPHEMEFPSNLQKMPVLDEMLLKAQAASGSIARTAVPKESIDRFNDQFNDEYSDQLSSIAQELADSSKRASLRQKFMRLVTMYAMALCADKLDTTLIGPIDQQFSSIGTMLELDFSEIKKQELERCASQSKPATSTTTTPAAAIDKDDVRFSESEFIEHVSSGLIEQFALEAEAEWNQLRQAIEDAEKKPESSELTQAEWLRRNEKTISELKNQSAHARSLYQNLRNRTEISQLEEASPAYNKVFAAAKALFNITKGSRKALISSQGGQKSLARRIEVLQKRVNESLAYEHFPTPEHVIREMLSRVEIKPGTMVLEPSAGEGNIADVITSAYPEATIHVGEFDSTLSSILKLKGYNVVSGDFLSYKPQPIYDVIVMNPPFDRGVDIEHVQHAYKLLKDGGRLVAITSAAAIDGKEEINYDFKDFVAERGKYRLMSAADFMGPSGKLSNGRSITIAVAMLELTRKPNDKEASMSSTEAIESHSGALFYDIQGAALYRVVEIVEDPATGKQQTIATNLVTGVSRTFNGLVKIGPGRFLNISEDAVEALIEKLKKNEKGERDSEGKISLPARSKVPMAELKPLRVVTARAELMPNAPAVDLFNKTVASNIDLTSGQREGINRALATLNSEGAFLLADGTGFGKTFQQLIIAATIAEQTKKPALIFTKSPNIIESSFYPDARALQIATPDAIGKKERAITFKGSSSLGLKMKRLNRFDDVSGKKLDPKAIYIASYHVYGLWKGDQQIRQKLKVLYDQKVKQLIADTAEKKKQINENSYMSSALKKERIAGLEEEMLAHPYYKEYYDLRAHWQDFNQEYFSEIGQKFSVVLSDEAHAYKNYNPDDIADGSLQAYRGMVLNDNAERRVFATATPIDKVEHIRYLKSLGLYKTEAQYMRMMLKLGFVWYDPEYQGTTLVRRGGFGVDKRLPPEYVLNNVGRLFENLTMASTMVKRELSLDNFTARNIMIGGKDSSEDEQLAVARAKEVLKTIESTLRGKKRCTASMVNEKKFALEPYKIQKVIEITKNELLEGRQVVIFASLVNDSGPSYSTKADPQPCSVVNKPSTINTLKRELGELFGHDQIALVTGTRNADDESLDDGPHTSYNYLDDEDSLLGFDEQETSYADQAHQAEFFLSDRHTVGLADNSSGVPLSDALAKQRKADIDAFQRGDKRILLTTPTAGGTGISLDDTVGNAPRTVIIMTAPFSSVDVVQILGRINRAKTKSEQRAYFLWMDVAIDKRLKDIISSKLKILGAAVEGEVQKVSVEEAEFASSENTQENNDDHNIDKKGNIREHSLELLEKVDARNLPTRRPFIITRSSRLGKDITEDGQSRSRWQPIRVYPSPDEPKSGHKLLDLFVASHAEVVKEYGLERHTDRYEGPYLEARPNENLWRYLLNWLKPENTRFAIADVAEQAFHIGDRVQAATDIIEADAVAGTMGTVTRVWQRRVRKLSQKDGKVELDEAGNEVFSVTYDYMVEFDNGERANNLEIYEIVPAGTVSSWASRLDQEQEQDEALSGLAGLAGAENQTENQPKNYISSANKPPAEIVAQNVASMSLADRMSMFDTDIKSAVSNAPTAKHRRSLRAAADNSK